MSNRPSENELEDGLQRMFPAPSAGFVNGLEQRLLQQAAEQSRPAERRGFAAFFRARAWATAAAAVVLAFFALVAIVGPQETLAAVQRLFGYIPGIGFVEDPQQPQWVLAEPAAVERDGVTVTIEKVLANAEYTQVRLRVDGLPQDKSLFDMGWGERSQQPILFVPNPELEVGTGQGEQLISSGSVSGAGDFIWAEYSFPPLPAGIDRMTLLLPRIPGLAAGVAPEDWSIEIPLQEAAASGLVATTAEPRASEPVSGARLVIESVAATTEGTALKVRLLSEIEGRRPGVDWRGETRGGLPVDLSTHGLSLVDEQGQAYPLTHEQTLYATHDGAAVLLAPPLDPARSYTLRLEGANFETTFTGNQPPAFRLDVPDGAALGDRWALDETYEVAGFSFHLTEAALRPGVSGGVVLALTIDPVPGVSGVGIRCADLDVCSASGFTVAGPDRPMQTEVYLDEVPAGALALTAQTIHETAIGPWEVDFQVEERD